MLRTLIRTLRRRIRDLRSRHPTDYGREPLPRIRWYR